MMEASERQKANKELSLKLIRKNLRIQNPEVVEAAYEDGIALTTLFYRTSIQNRRRVARKKHGAARPANL